MTKTLNVAILGATGAVGEAILSILAERQFPVGQLYPLASENSAGDTIKFKGQTLEVLDAAQFDFSLAQLAFFSAGSEISKQYVPIANAAGCVVIDNTAAFRYQDDVPLVVPEVNGDVLKDYQGLLVANPNCSPIQMVVALKPLYDAVGISRINVATYQSVSGSGKAAISELIEQLSSLLNGKPVTPEVYSQQIAFNALPAIDAFQDNGYTKEEMKMHLETRKIFQDDKISVNATAVRIPTIYGHGEAVHVETRDKITLEDCLGVLANQPGLTLCQDKDDLPTAFTHAIGQDDVFVGRVREDFTHPNGINLWVVADNIRKGAALNAVQIAELLVVSD